MHSVFSAIAMGFFFATTSFNTCQAASDTARQLHYRVHHPVFGDIGTYNNTIETTGDITTVLTSVHLKVAALGVVLHREDAERTERMESWPPGLFPGRNHDERTGGRSKRRGTRRHIQHHIAVW
jgi:hypothetical protein